MAWNDVGVSGNSGESNKVIYTKLKTGVNVGRILDDHPQSRWTHWIPQANGGKGLSVDCAKGSGSCPVCTAIAEDKAANRKARYTSRKQHALNWLNRETGEVEILEQGQKVFGGLKILLEQMGDLRNYDVKIVRTGETFNNIDYNVLPVFPPTPLTDAEKSMEKYEADTLRKSFTVEQIEQFLAGATMDDVFASDNDDNGEVDTSADNNELSVDFSSTGALPY